MPGWEQSLDDCDGFEDLPEEAKDYLAFIEEYLGVNLTILSKGPKRKETIVL
jgi:adenylosuccinate synthase